MKFHDFSRASPKGQVPVLVCQDVWEPFRTKSDGYVWSFLLQVFLSNWLHEKQFLQKIQKSTSSMFFSWKTSPIKTLSVIYSNAVTLELWVQIHHSAP